MAQPEKWLCERLEFESGDGSWRERGRPEKAAHSPSLFASSNFTDADLVRRLAHKEIENTGEGKRIVHARIEPPHRLVGGFSSLVGFKL